MVDSTSARRIRRIVIDFICLAIVAIPAAVFEFGVKPFHRGFFCDDQSLMHPYKDSTISSAVLIIVSAILSLIIILTTEGIIYRCNKPTGDPTVFTIGRLNANSFMINSYKYIGLIVFTVFVNQFFTDVGKHYLGRLRPHFFAVCKPDYSKFNCSSGYIDVQNVCTGTDTYNLENARLSFPSGHTSMAFTVMFFLTLYVQSRITWKGSKLLKHTIQVILMLMAFATSLSRISDYKHHWSDVVGGAVLGCAVTLSIVYCASDLLEPRYKYNVGIGKKVEENQAYNSQISARTSSIVASQELKYIGPNNI